MNMSEKLGMNNDQASAQTDSRVHVLYTANYYSNYKMLLTESLRIYFIPTRIQLFRYNFCARLFFPGPHE